MDLKQLKKKINELDLSKNEKLKLLRLILLIAFNSINTKEYTINKAIITYYRKLTLKGSLELRKYFDEIINMSYNYLINNNIKGVDKYRIDKYFVLYKGDVDAIQVRFCVRNGIYVDNNNLVLHKKSRDDRDEEERKREFYKRFYKKGFKLGKNMATSYKNNWFRYDKELKGKNVNYIINYLNLDKTDFGRRYKGKLKDFYNKGVLEGFIRQYNTI